jgi:hypothetical protein
MIAGKCGVRHVIVGMISGREDKGARRMLLQRAAAVPQQSALAVEVVGEADGDAQVVLRVGCAIRQTRAHVVDFDSAQA